VKGYSFVMGETLSSKFVFVCNVIISKKKFNVTSTLYVELKSTALICHIEIYYNNYHQWLVTRNIYGLLVVNFVIIQLTFLFEFGNKICRLALVFSSVMKINI
jgi:hypothetical protein